MEMISVQNEPVEVTLKVTHVLEQLGIAVWHECALARLWIKTGFCKQNTSLNSGWAIELEYLNGNTSNGC